ncbi:MAG: AI-2E family transporter, partial [Planctomycetes bacterium]|nr:AI-2E family transporter [Planctomycetota bacterium]
MVDPAPRPLPTGTRLLLTLASAVIVIAGLKEASAVVIPTMLAAVLALICYLPMKALQKRGISSTWSIVIVFVVAVVILLGIVAVVGTSIVSFQDRIGQLDVGWDAQFDRLLAWAGPMLEGLGVAREDFANVKQVFDPAGLLK